MIENGGCTCSTYSGPEVDIRYLPEKAAPIRCTCGNRTFTLRWESAYCLIGRCKKCLKDNTIIDD